MGDTGWCCEGDGKRGHAETCMYHENNWRPKNPVLRHDTPPADSTGTGSAEQPNENEMRILIPHYRAEQASLRAQLQEREQEIERLRELVKVLGECTVCDACRQLAEGALEK